MTLVVADWELLRKALAEGLECRIEGFTGDFAFLSNFFTSPIEVRGILFPTVEHAYQAAKTTDPAERQQIVALHSPGQAKRAGQKLQLREGWETRKLSVMEELVRLKFATHAELRDKLVAAGSCHLEETNTWGDRFWGVCQGEGENHLGRILMRTREHARGQGG
jgi:ribA/ribD-fused uncharacterized protein